MKLFKMVVLSALTLLPFAIQPVAYAKDGYEFKPTVTYEHVRSDPDGIWSDPDDFVPTGWPEQFPSLYTARVTTPAGVWILSQSTANCNMQSNCQFILALKSKNGKTRKLASGMLILGGTATLSMNYRKLMTEEVDENIKPFTGSYDVAAPK